MKRILLDEQQSNQSQLKKQRRNGTVNSDILVNKGKVDMHILFDKDYSEQRIYTHKISKPKSVLNLLTLSACKTRKIYKNIFDTPFAVASKVVTIAVMFAMRFPLVIKIN